MKKERKKESNHIKHEVEKEKCKEVKKGRKKG